MLVKKTKNFPAGDSSYDLRSTEQSDHSLLVCFCIAYITQNKKVVVLIYHFLESKILQFCYVDI